MSEQVRMRTGKSEIQHGLVVSVKVTQHFFEGAVQFTQFQDRGVFHRWDSRSRFQTLFRLPG